LYQGRTHNMMCFPNLSFYDAEQWLLVNSVTLESYLTMIQISPSDIAVRSMKFFECIPHEFFSGFEQSTKMLHSLCSYLMNDSFS